MALAAAALGVAAVGTTAEARRVPARLAGGAPAASAAWIGTFTTGATRAPCGDCTGPRTTAKAGQVRVLTPSDGSHAAAGEVVVVSPLLGAIAHGRVEAGQVALPWFVDDARDSDDGVLVLPGTAQPRLVEAGKPDVAQIRAALLRDETLAGITRALVNLEIGAVDVDGDGRADFAVTYGCSAWNDGACQGRGQFFLVRHGARWDEIP